MDREAASLHSQSHRCITPELCLLSDSGIGFSLVCQPRCELCVQGVQVACSL